MRRTLIMLALLASATAAWPEAAPTQWARSLDLGWSLESPSTPMLPQLEAAPLLEPEE